MTLTLTSRLAHIMVSTALLVSPAVQAQVASVDPNIAARAPLSTPGVPAAATPSLPTSSVDLNADLAPAAGGQQIAAAQSVPSSTVPSSTAPTYHKDDLIGAAEGALGKGARGLGAMMEKILRDQGEPNAYISGREASGAFVVGLRYGSGTLFHKIEGKRPVYWTGPSLGFDAGGDAANVFVLVYNLYDSQDIYKRFGQVEGRAYFVGGLSATYLRRGNVALIPVRLGAGLRLGANIGYMKFSEKNRWFPF